MRRRGGFLLFRAVIYAGYGYSLTGLHQTPTLTHALRAQVALFPLTAWAAIWLSSAAILTITAFINPPRDYLGFAVGGGLPVVWAALSGITWVQNGHGSSDRTWVNAVIFFGLGGSMLIAAGLVDPPKPAATDAH